MDDDEYEPREGTAQGSPAKRIPRVQARASKKSKLDGSSQANTDQDNERVRTLDSPTPSSQADTTDIDVSKVHPGTKLEYPLPINCSPGDNIGRFMELRKNGMKLKDIPYTYAPISRPRHILDYPPYGDRDFRLLEDEVELYDIHYPPGQITRAWRLNVRDENDPDGRVLELFRMLEHGKRALVYQPSVMVDGKRKKVRTYTGRYSIPQLNAITENVCDNAQDAIELGRVACRLLNHAPFDLKVENFHSANPDPGGGGKRRLLTPERRFIDVVSLLTWNPEMDLSLLPEEFYRREPKGTHYGVYGAPIFQSKTSVSSFFRITANLFYTEDESPDGVRFQFDHTRIDVPATKDLQIPSGFTFGSGDLDTGSIETPKDETAVDRVMQYALYQTIGFIGTNRQIQNRFVSILDSYTLSPGTSRHGRVSAGLSCIDNGILDASSVFTSPKHVYDGMWLSYSTSLAGLLEGISTTQRQTTGPGFSPSFLRLRSRHRLDIAFLKQRFITLLAQGCNLLQAIFGVSVAADEINAGFITLDDIKASYDQYENDEQAKLTEQACCHCGKIRMRNEMVGSGDGRVYCKNCAATLHELEDIRVRTLTSRIRASLSTISRHEHEKFNVPEVMTKLSDNVIDEGTYIDGYSGQATDIRARARSRTLLPTGNTGIFASCSIEAPNAIHVADGKTFTHHPDNITLIRLPYNITKGTNLAAFMPWIPELLRRQSDVQDLRPVVGYHAEVDDKLQTFERFADNAYFIDKQLPFKNKSRVALKLDNAAFASLSREFSSGVWRGSRPRANELWRTKANGWTVSDEYRWDSQTIIHLKKCLAQMESSGSVFNPHDLKFPRNPKDNSPLFWRSNLMFEDTDWEFHNIEFTARYRTWRDSCNRHHETRESPATLFLLYALWWLRTGGQCHWFGFRFVYFSRHLQNYSFGRGVYYMDAEGNDVTTKPIQAGAPMSSGFTTTSPTDMGTDFDFTKLTVMVESWKANAARFNYPVALYPELKQVFDQIAPSTKWYNAIKARHEYNTNLPTPGSWRALKEKPTSAPDVDDEEEMVFQDAIDARENVTGLDEFREEGDLEDDGKPAPGESGVASGQLVGRGINPATQAHLSSRPRGEYRVVGVVDQEHILSNVVIHSGSFPNDVFGFPTQDGKFKTEDGVIVGKWAADLTITDVDGFRLGQLAGTKGRGQQPPATTQTGVVNPMNTCYQNIDWRLLLSSVRVQEMLSDTLSPAWVAVAAADQTKLSALVWRMLLKIQQGQFEESLQLLKEVWKAVLDLNPEWTQFNQQDAAEFLTSFLMRTGSELEQVLEPLFKFKLLTKTICLYCGIPGRELSDISTIMQVPVGPPTYETINIEGQDVSLSSPGNDFVGMLTTYLIDPQAPDEKAVCQECSKVTWTHRQTDMQQISDEPSDRIVQLLRFNNASEKLKMPVKLPEYFFKIVGHKGLYYLQFIGVHIGRTMFGGHYIGFERPRPATPVSMSDESRAELETPAQRAFARWAMFEDQTKEEGWTLEQIEEKHSGNSYLLRLAPASQADVEALLLPVDEAKEDAVGWLIKNGAFDQPASGPTFHAACKRGLVTEVGVNFFLGYIFSAYRNLVQPALPQEATEATETAETENLEGIAIRDAVYAAIRSLPEAADARGVMSEWMRQGWQAVRNTQALHNDGRARAEYFVDHLLNPAFIAQVVMDAADRHFAAARQARQATTERMRQARSYDKEVEPQLDEQKRQRDAARTAAMLRREQLQAEERAQQQGDWLEEERRLQAGNDMKMQHALVQSFQPQQGQQDKTGHASTGGAGKTGSGDGMPPPAKTPHSKQQKGGETPGSGETTPRAGKPGSRSAKGKKGREQPSDDGGGSARRTSGRNSGKPPPQYSFDGPADDSPPRPSFAYDGTAEDMETFKQLAGPGMLYLEGDADVMADDTTPPRTPHLFDIELPIRGSPRATRTRGQDDDELQSPWAHPARKRQSSVDKLLSRFRGKRPSSATDTFGPSPIGASETADSATDITMAQKATPHTDDDTVDVQDVEMQGDMQDVEMQGDVKGQGDVKVQDDGTSPHLPGSGRLPTPSHPPQHPRESPSKVKSLGRAFARSGKNIKKGYEKLRAQPYPSSSQRQLMSSIYQPPQRTSSSATLLRRPQTTENPPPSPTKRSGSQGWFTKTPDPMDIDEERTGRPLKQGTAKGRSRSGAVLALLSSNKNKSTKSAATQQLLSQPAAPGELASATSQVKPEDTSLDESEAGPLTTDVEMSEKASLAANDSETAQGAVDTSTTHDHYAPALITAAAQQQRQAFFASAPWKDPSSPYSLLYGEDASDDMEM